MKKLIGILFFIISTSLTSQTMTYGDSSVMNVVRKKTSWIYEHKDATHFYLTQKRLLNKKTNGLSITAHSYEGDINRIIAIANTKSGQWAIEWYFDEDQLIHVYSTFEYFEEAKHKGSWQNFKGLYGWESRYYLQDETVKYSKHNGRQNLDKRHVAKSLISDARSILAFVKHKQTEK